MNPPTDLAAWRKAQRAELLAAREAIPLDVRRGRNETITHLLSAAFDLLAGASIGFCWPFKGEPDTRFFLHEMRKRGSRTALPVVVEKKQPLEFREWWPGAPTTPGVFDLPIPQGTEIMRPRALLVPPVGFDVQGYRLGYGGGFFDRTLAAATPQPLKIAVAFEVSRMQTIYPQPYDVPMDFVVTEEGVAQVVDGRLLAMPDLVQVRAIAAQMLRARAPG
ncbi:MAG: 5-formyltetrahydrofolate cyclo-ligase [Betaproteobacteria bacterium]|nr:5-formyltetrahydrofolate cyclo-ligase [Betaproteobacteria bacterium]